jgi:hypothetical protein
VNPLPALAGSGFVVLTVAKDGSNKPKAVPYKFLQVAISLAALALFLYKWYFQGLPLHRDG